MLLVADGLTRFTADNQTGRKGTSVMAGAGYTFLGKLAVRAGGGYDASTGNGYLTFGLSGVSEIGAFDGGVRQDLTRSMLASGAEVRETVVQRLPAPLHSGLADAGPVAGSAGSPRAREQSVTRGNLSTRPLSVLTWKRRSVSRGRGREPGSPTR